MLTAVGANFGAYKTAGTGTICRSTGTHGACKDEASQLASWTHTQIRWSITDWSSAAFPGNVTVRVGNDTHHLADSNTLRFVAKPPKIVDHNNDTHLTHLASMRFPTVGGDVFNVYVKDLNTGDNDMKNVIVYVGDEKANHTYVSSDCAPAKCTLTVTMPPGQGENLPLRVEQEAIPSNTIVLGGYDAPILYNIFSSGKTFGAQKDSVYGSLERDGIQAAGEEISVDGVNFGTASTGGVFIEFCATSFDACTMSRVACCTNENLWEPFPTVFTSAGSSVQIESTLAFNLSAGSGYDHLIRASVSGQKSNAIAVRYVAPTIQSVSNQNLPTSNKDFDESPGQVVINGNHFGAPGSVTALRYDDPVVNIGVSPKRQCLVTSWTNTQIKCDLPSGEGKDLAVQIVAGEQASTNSKTYSYAAPNITSISPQFGSTDGTTLITITGRNFGTADADVTLEFVRNDATTFVRTVTRSPHSHRRLEQVAIPEGQGTGIELRVNVSGQTSVRYLRPKLDNQTISKYPEPIDLGAGDMYLPPLLYSISPANGPTSGCDVWEDLTVWKKRYLQSGGSGRKCIKYVQIELTGYSLGKGEAEILMKRDGAWEKIASDSDAEVSPPTQHEHDKIVFNAPSGVGKDLPIKIKIGGKDSYATQAITYSFDPPNDLSMRPVPFSAQNADEPLEILAENGFGEVKTVVNVTIGGRECKDPTWNPVHRESGRPYISCRPTADVAGSKSIDFNVAGFTFSEPAQTSMAFNRSLVFSVCMSGNTDVASGITKSYYGRPCMGNVSVQNRFHRSAPCVGQSSGKGEICAECPVGAFCFVPGTPWAGNTGEGYTYFDPTSKAGFWRLERELAGENREDAREARLRVSPSRWDPDYKSENSQLHQKDFVFDFVPCEPSSACSGANECDLPYRQFQERCRAWQSDNTERLNCTKTSDCTSRGGDGECTVLHPENCAVCDMDLATSDGVGQCRCTPAPRCGGCTQAATYANGTKVKSYFKLDGECVECPENVPLLIAGCLLGICFCLYGASVMESRNINTSLISIAVDYFQVLAIFRNANIPWPLLLRDFYKFFAIFNLNIDIAAPECLAFDVTYSLKFWLTQLMPLIALVLTVFVFIFQRFVGYSTCRSRYRARPDWHSYISVYLILVYFLYLMLVRRALQIFTCNPMTPSDGFLYTTFTSAECPYGLCRCYDASRHEDTKDFFQGQFIVPATAFLLLYGAGFPFLTYVILKRNKKDVKTDQVLRAYGLGNELELSTKSVWAARTSYKHLYYFFKPGKTYWVLWILYRKVAISIIAVLFYSNPGFQLAFTILVLFSAYVLQVRHRPFMSTAEMTIVRKNFAEKETDFHIAVRGLVQTKKALAEKKNKQRGKKRQSMRNNVTARNSIIGKIKSKKKGGPISFAGRSRGLSQLAADKRMEILNAQTYMFDYNSVELFMIGSAICVCATGIMFTSGNFQNRPDLEWQSSIISVLVIALVIFSLCYLAIALMSEFTSGAASGIFGKLQELCGGKKVNTDEDENSMKDFDLALNPLHAKDDRKDKRQIQQQASELKRQEEQNKLLLERLKTQKRQGATGVQRGQQHKARKGKANKKEFAQSYAQHDEL
jgi:hypothetical protein